MKKSLLAMALMGVFAGSAFAQSSVTMYGTIDVGVSGHTKSFGINHPQGRFGAAVDTDGRADSVWGLKGVEDLGNGTKAIFQLESSLDVVDGKLGQVASTTTFDRHAYAGLATNYGTVVFGRTRDTIDTFVSPYSSPVNQFSNKYGFSLHNRIGNNMSGQSYDRMIKVTTANYSGVQAGGFFGHLTNSNNSLDSTKRGADKAYGLGANFDRANYGVGLAWTHENKATLFPFYGKKDIFALGSRFSIAQVALNGTLSHVKTKNGYYNPNYDHTKSWLLDLGTTYKLNSKTALGISGQYLMEKAHQTSLSTPYNKTKGWQVNLVADYALSKRTDAYAGLYYQKYKVKDHQGNLISKNSDLPGRVPASDIGIGMRVGVNHNF